MRVVAAMTTEAVAADSNLGGVLGRMASVALQLLVRACQRILRLCRVIEPP